MYLHTLVKHTERFRSSEGYYFHHCDLRKYVDRYNRSVNSISRQSISLTSLRAQWVSHQQKCST